MNYPPPPRKLPLFTSVSFLFEHPRALFFGAWFSIFPLLMLIVLLFIEPLFIRDNPDFELINNNGIEADGTIEKFATVKDISIQGKNPIKIFYSYNDSNNNRLDSVETLSLSTVRDWKVGDKIKVKHFKGDSIIPEVEPFDFPFWIFFVFLSVFFIVGAIPFGWALAGASKKRNLYANGVEYDGSILSMAPLARQSFFFAKNRFQISYAFHSSKGKTLYGESASSDLAFLNEKRKGDPVCLLVSPKNEKKSCAVDERIMRKIMGRAA